ncbi:MAG: DUF2236 domain-containing protein [Streptosporangiales bacterium]|nr:DUF2236 domain-containing protein [Streptosporangiales bacterium]
MSTVVTQGQTGTTAYPKRFRAAEERGAKIGRVLRVAAGVTRADEALLDEMGRRMMTRDELAADLVRAMRRPSGAENGAAGGERVTMAQFRTALAEGVEKVPGAPPALARFFETVDQVPEWVDWDEVERGARAIRRLGRTADDVLLQLSLIGGYRFGGPPDLLVETGGLSGPAVMRRLGETALWSIAVIQPGAMRRSGEGFRLTVHVRLMHALLNDRFESNGRWDTAQWGLPVNQTDLAATLGLFSSTLLLGARALGWLVTPAESRAVMHLWKYVGWLMGVDEDWLFDTERQQNVFDYHILLAQADVTPAGAVLTGALAAGEAALDRPWPSAVRSRYARARLLSMLRYFLGSQGLRDLGLPRALPWAVPGVVAGNIVRSGVVARTRAGRRYLERDGDRYRSGRIRLLFGGDVPGIGPLPGSR